MTDQNLDPDSAVQHVIHACIAIGQRGLDGQNPNALERVVELLRMCECVWLDEQLELV